MWVGLTRKCLLMYSTCQHYVETEFFFRNGVDRNYLNMIVTKKVRVGYSRKFIKSRVIFAG